MASTRHATAAALEREPAVPPAEAARRRWVEQAAERSTPLDDLLEEAPEPRPPAAKPARKAAPRPAASTPAASLPAAPAPALPAGRARPAAGAPAPRATGAPGDRGRLLLLAGAGLAALVALYVALTAAVGFAQVTLDDIRYGRPRTAQMDLYAGHAGEAPGQPSHFLALNLDRRVVVIELPGGDPQHALTITGPYLFGAGEDLTPVQLSASDVNGDGAPDLLLTVKNEQLVYLNDPAKSTFHLMTPQERDALPANAGAAPAGGTP